MIIIRIFVLLIRFLVLFVLLFPLSVAVEACKRHPMVQRIFEEGYGEIYYLHMCSIYLITSIPVFYVMGNGESKANIIFSSSLFMVGLIMYIITAIVMSI